MKQRNCSVICGDTGVAATRGSPHSVWVNPANLRQASVPRHREVNDYTARSICRQLGIPEP